MTYFNAKTSPKHLLNKDNHLKTATLEKSYSEPSNKDLTCASSKYVYIVYVVTENVHESWTGPPLKEQTEWKTYSCLDGKINWEACIHSSDAKNSIPLSFVPKLMEFGKVLSKDYKSLSPVKMERNAATYKLKDGFMLIN